MFLQLCELCWIAKIGAQRESEGRAFYGWPHAASCVRYVAALVLIPELTCLEEVDNFFGGFFSQPGIADLFRTISNASAQFAASD